MSTNGREPSNMTCEGCGAKCCRHVTVTLDPPDCKQDYDEIIWFLLHRGVSVYIDHEDDWNIEFETVCEGLDDELCTIYEDRPRVCSDYELETCVEWGEGPYYKVRWETKGELIAWLDKKKIDWRYKKGPDRGKRTRKPLLVQIAGSRAS